MNVYLKRFELSSQDSEWGILKIRTNRLGSNRWKDEFVQGDFHYLNSSFFVKTLTSIQLLQVLLIKQTSFLVSLRPTVMPKAGFSASIYIYVLLEIFPVSPRGFESFTRRFGCPFGAIFKRGGEWSTWS